MNKYTLISGFTTRRPNGWGSMTPEQRYESGYLKAKHKSAIFKGHWSHEAATRKADAMGIRYNLKVVHGTLYL